MRTPRFLVVELLFGQDSLQRIAGLGDVGEIDLGLKRLGRTRLRRARIAGRARPPFKLRANLLRLMFFKRTGVRLAICQPQLRQNIQDLTAFHFHLAREIVDSNLAHPPLFRYRSPKPLVAHSYLMAMVWC
jgi:hypothetical protein